MQLRPFEDEKMPVLENFSLHLLEHVRVPVIERI